MKLTPALLLVAAQSLALAATAIAAGPPPSPKPPVMSDVLAASKPEDWRTPAPEDLLYLELASGRVVIELAPLFAPRHVANIRALARAHYWDGLAIVRVQDNYVVQWADPDAENAALKRKLPTGTQETLAAEFDRMIGPDLPYTPLADRDSYAPETGFTQDFAVGRDPEAKRSWLLHCYGTVGAGRDVGADSGGGTELYAVIGHAPRQLDRNVTLVGRVISGMERLSSLPRGHGNLGFFEKGEAKVPIRALRLASDVPEKDRPQLEVLRTDTPLFAQLVESRRNRREDWFHYQAGHIDACNVPLPVREKKH